MTGVDERKEEMVRVITSLPFGQTPANKAYDEPVNSDELMYNPESCISVIYGPKWHVRSLKGRRSDEHT